MLYAYNIGRRLTHLVKILYKLPIKDLVPPWKINTSSIMKTEQVITYVFRNILHMHVTTTDEKRGHELERKQGVHGKVWRGKEEG